mmetsp:Transcript_7997/g.29763  ORF Transcript_7997/g.29763 Transcript_7997/m.29763 type:complete len:105 (+) Transcript_7997:239-553(+)
MYFIVVGLLGTIRRAKSSRESWLWAIISQKPAQWNSDFHMLRADRLIASINYLSTLESHSISSRFLYTSLSGKLDKKLRSFLASMSNTTSGTSTLVVNTGPRHC